MAQSLLGGEICEKLPKTAVEITPLPSSVQFLRGTSTNFIPLDREMFGLSNGVFRTEISVILVVLRQLKV